MEPDLNRSLQDEESPLHAASRAGHLEAVRLLLADGKADPNPKDLGKMTPLHFACSYGHVEIVRLLLAQDQMDPYFQDNAGRTALACAKMHEGVSRVLREEFGVSEPL
eukprot:gb/GECG01009835.1/.p1 GENE.gb/GECG01009835.1/~~gb/GECG01009835.1/.p1  ORF type:complete len:108 (+),score=8.24 gb/GECG01009835.1/:1-324(+)